MSGLGFEFFPARDADKLKTLARTIKALSLFQPDYFTVTFGAGGSEKEATTATLEDIKSQTKIPVASHITFSGMHRQDILDYTDALWRKGHKKLIALRGDADELSEPAFDTTADFVAALKAQHDFDIAVACYPETHPLAASQHDDLEMLKQKQLAGASSAITQMFFDNDIFSEFVRRARNYGITIPIIPGILPIHSLEAVTKFAGKCGAQIPQSVIKAFESGRKNGLKDDDIASALLVDQVRDLIERGFDDLHIFALNRAELPSIAADAYYTHKGKYHTSAA